MLADAMSRLQKGAGNSARGATFVGLPVLSMAKVQEMWKTDPRIRALAEAKDEARPVATLSESQNFFYLQKTELGEYIFDELIAGGYNRHRRSTSEQCLGTHAGTKKAQTWETMIVPPNVPMELSILNHGVAFSNPRFATIFSGTSIVPSGLQRS